MRLEGFAVINELDQEQQQRFIDLLERYKDNEDIVYGITQSLLLLGYKVID